MVAGAAIGTGLYYTPVFFLKGSAINFTAQFTVQSGVSLYQDGTVSIQNVLENRIDYADVALGGFGGGFSSIGGIGTFQVALPAFFDYQSGEFTSPLLGNKTWQHTMIDLTFNSLVAGTSLGLNRLANSYSPIDAKMMVVNQLWAWTESSMGKGYSSFRTNMYINRINFAKRAALTWQNLHIYSITRPINFNVGKDYSVESAGQAGSSILKESNP